MSEELLSASFEPTAFVSALLSDAEIGGGAGGGGGGGEGALASAEAASARVRAALAAVDGSLRGLLLADDGAQLGALLGGGARLSQRCARVEAGVASVRVRRRARRAVSDAAPPHALQRAKQPVLARFPSPRRQRRAG
jgi:hypothetical protein